MTTTEDALPRCHLAWVWAWALALLVGGALMHRSAVDLAMFQAINGWAEPRVVVASIVLSVLGLGATATIVAGWIGLRRPTIVASVLIAVLCGGAAVQTLKWAVADPRPIAVLGPAAVHLFGLAQDAHSMPSGHAALWAAMLSLATMRAGWSLPVRVLAFLLASAGMVARCVVGAHWPADLLVGAGIGTACAASVAGTGIGRGAVRALAQGMASRTGGRLTAAMLAAVSAGLWVSEREYPEAAPLYTCLCVAGASAAARWWWRDVPWPQGIAQSRNRRPMSP